MRSIKIIIFCCLTSTALLCVTPLGRKNGVAQSSDFTVYWDTPQLVYETTGDISSPNLVADEFGRLHLLFSQSPEPFGTGQGGYAVFYTQLTSVGWQDPIDILVDPFSDNASSTDLAILPDGSGVISYQGYPGQANLSTSENLDGRLNEVHSWQLPAAITNTAVTCHSLSVSQEGRLYLVYGSVGVDNALNFTAKHENMWMEPVSLASLPPDESVLSAEILIGNGGQLLVFWTNTAYPSGYPPLATYFSTSIDEGKTWSTPIEIGGRDMALAGAAINDRNIHVLLTGRAGVPGRYDAWSGDGGQNWQSPVVIDRVGAGLSGGNMVVDSRGGFHAAFGSATNSQVAVAHWDGSAWLLPENVEQTIQPTLEDIDLEIVNGNQLVVVFVQGHVRIWAVHGVVQGAPQQTPVNLPEQPVPTATSTSDTVVYDPAPLEQTSLDGVAESEAEKVVVFPMIAVWLPVGIILLTMMIRKFLRRI